MMTDGAQLLRALQHGDSFFPGGATAFSWGLEPLVTDGRVRSAADVERFLGGLLAGRWASFDRPALVAAHHGAADTDRVLAVDRRIEAMTLPRELREGSRRAGGALLTIHAALETPFAAGYHRLVRRGNALGHAAVAQGLAWRGAGLDETTAVLVSAHALATGVLGAALRLGRVGHGDAQRIRSRLGEAIRRLAALPCPAVEEMSAFAPLAEIAAMRHEHQSARLFAT
jgi:urease accessory protein